MDMPKTDDGPSPEEISKIFRKLGCLGIVSLIEHITSKEGEEIISIGSSDTRVLKEVQIQILFLKKSTPSILFPNDNAFSIGSPDGKITAIQYLSVLSDVFDMVPENVRKDFNKMCSELVQAMKKPDEIHQI